MTKRNIDIVNYHRKFAITPQEAEEMDFLCMAAYYKESKRQAMKLYNLKEAKTRIQKKK
jgi:hypothetical protein